MGLICHVFGEEGTAYVRAYLEANEAWGKRLGALLLARHDVGAGTVRAWIPEGADPRDFEQRLATAEVWGREPGSRTGELLLDALRAAGERAVLLSEDAYARRTDGWIARAPDQRLVFCGEDVYRFAGADDAPGGIGSLAFGATWGPAVAVAGVLPADLPRLRSRQSLAEPVLRHLAATATAIAVGAWDDESAVVWTPRGC